MLSKSLHFSYIMTNSKAVLKIQVQSIHGMIHFPGASMGLVFNFNFTAKLFQHLFFRSDNSVFVIHDQYRFSLIFKDFRSVLKLSDG